MFNLLKKKIENGIKKIKSIEEKQITEKNLLPILNDLKFSLIQSDVTFKTAESICEKLKKDLINKKFIRGKLKQEIKNAFEDSLLNCVNQESFDLIKKIKSENKPFLIIFFGANGNGKTLTSAKISYILKKNGLTCIFAAADTFRAASIEQLENHGKKLGNKVVKYDYGADAAAVIYSSMEYAKNHNIDVVLADTAGRSHINENLMQELKKICRVNNPNIKILVLDSLTGNDIYEQCKFFDDEINVDAMILTKFDIYEKGGSALSASHTINKPILYLGTGQMFSDLIKFDPKKIVSNLLN